MNIEDRLRGGLQWQAEQLDAYDVAVDRVEARGVQRRRRTQGVAAGGIAAALTLVVAGGLLLDFRSQEAGQTVVADDLEEASTIFEPDVEENAAPLIEFEDPIQEADSSEVPIALDALPDLIGVNAATIVSRRSDGTATVLAESGPANAANFAPAASQARVVVQDGVRGFVQFGSNDIYWTPSAAAEPNLVIKITTTGAELGYTAQRLVYGDVFLGEGGNPTVIYGEERERSGIIRSQRIVVRDLLTGERTTLAEAEVDDDSDDGLVAMTQISFGRGLVALVRAEPCAVEVLNLAGEVERQLGVSRCATGSYGSISPNGETLALVDFQDRRDIGASVYSVTDGEELLRVTTEDMEIRPVDHPIDYDGRFVVAARSDVTIVFDRDDESVHTLPFTGPSTISSVSSIVGGSSSLRAADVDEPFFSSCPRQGGGLVTIRPDVDGEARPPCVRTDSGQRLLFENDTESPWRVNFAHIDVEIEPGGVHEDQFALGAYLAPGVHRISTQPTPAATTNSDEDDPVDAIEPEAPIGTELWFDPAGRYQIALRTFGPIEFGDFFESANTAIGGVLEDTAVEQALADGCATTRVGAGSDPLLMVVPADDSAGDPTDEVIVASASVTRPGVTTLSGIGVGSSVREVVAAYRNRIDIADSTTFDGGIDLIFTPESEEDSDYRIVFVADDSQVLSYRSGLVRYVMPAGGCEGYLAADDEPGDG